MSIGLQNHTTGATGTMDNPDVNANSLGIYARGNSYPFDVYDTGIVLSAISVCGSLDREANVSGNITTHGAIAQDMVDWLAWAQSDSHKGGVCGEGGWSYGALDNNDDGNGTHYFGPDNSNSGYAVLGLAYAQDSGLIVPDWVKTELNEYIECIQDINASSANFGGSWYDHRGDGIGVNILKTGNLIFEMAFVGDTPDTPRVVNALAYLEAHWNDTSGKNQPPGWDGDPAQYQTMFTAMKGLEYMGIDTFGDPEIDWFDDFTDAIVDQQETDGSWNDSSGRGKGNPVIITEWALLVLEKASPPPPLEGIPDQCILSGDSFDTFDLDNYTTGSPDHYNYSGNVNLSVSIDPEHVVTISYTAPWTGSETILFTAYDASNTSVDSDDAIFEVCPVPLVGDIPGQTTPFETFDLDDSLLNDSASPVTWSSSYACINWTVDIDSDNNANVTAPDGAKDPCNITFTATSSCCGSNVSDSDVATFDPNQPPNTTNASPSISCIWPPNNKFVDISIEGVTDPDGDAVSIVISCVTSDEPTATIEGAAGKNHAPDANGIGTATAELRAERSGTQNGRVYEISFIASDGIEETEGTVTVCVPHDVRKGTCDCVDDGQNYNATIIN